MKGTAVPLIVAVNISFTSTLAGVAVLTCATAAVLAVVLATVQAKSQVELDITGLVNAVPAVAEVNIRSAPELVTVTQTVA